jgi:hypothetical protein
VELELEAAAALRVVMAGLVAKPSCFCEQRCEPRVSAGQCFAVQFKKTLQWYMVAPHCRLQL